jgi:hypothetical protein
MLVVSSSAFDPERTPASMVAAFSGIPCSGANMPGLDFNIAFLGLDVKMNADGALTRQLANEDLRARAAGRASQAMWTLSSATRMTLEATTPAVMRASTMRLVVAGEISRCSKSILRPQATWAKIAIGPTQ